MPHIAKKKRISILKKKQLNLIVIILHKEIFTGIIYTHNKKNVFYFTPDEKFDPSQNNHSIKILIKFLIWGKINTNNL